MKIRIHGLLVFLLLLTCTAQGQQAPVVTLYHHNTVKPLDEAFLLWVDSTGQKSLDDVLQPATNARFRPLDTTVIASRVPMAFWLQVTMTSPATLEDWTLVLKNPAHARARHLFEYLAANHRVDVWQVSRQGSVKHYRTGMLVPAREKIFDEHARVNAVTLTLPAGDTATLFLRVQNLDGYPAHLAAELRAPGLTLPLNTADWAGQTFLFMGVTGILTLLGFFFFFFARDRSNLYFALHALALCLHYTYLHPDCLLITWFVPNHPGLSLYLWAVLTHGTFIFLALFGRSFVELPEINRRLDRIMLVLTGFMVLSLAGTITALVAGWTFNFLPLLAVGLAGMVLLGIRLTFIPGALTLIYGVGAAWMCFFAILGVLWVLEVLDLPFNPWPVSQMGMMVIYTLGLAYKLRQTERARSEAARILDLDAVKSRFFAHISHEFRTPLSLILGPLNKAREQWPESNEDLLPDAGGSAELTIPARHVGMMHRNAERLKRLIEQLLDLSRLENGSMRLQVSEGDPTPFLRAVISGFENEAERRRIHFHTAFPREGTHAFFDHDKLEKIVVNLLSNAFKFTPEKGYVSVLTDLDNDRLRIRVEDSGPGISKEEVDRIFEWFYQVAGTEDKGTGIGLGLVKELVDLHRGQISVDTGKNKGSVFTVSLPVSRSAFTAAETAPVKGTDPSRETVYPKDFVTPIQDEISPGEKEAGGTKPLLLIVEDHPDLRQYIAENMQDTYRILVAANGKTGREIAVSTTPDLLVCDVMMPEMDGLSLCAFLKKDERTSHIPIIMLTARAGQDDKIEGLETGADAYLTKPFDARELRAVAANLVQRQQRMQEYLMRQGQAFASTWLHPGPVAVPSAEKRFLEKVKATIEQQIGNEFFSVEDLARDVHFSRSQLHRKLKALTGKGPNEIIRSCRLQRAKDLLEQGYGNVSEVAMSVGYSSLSYFTRSFKEAFGRLPSEV